MKKQRKVFGRRRVKLDNTTFVIELRKNGLFARELRSRREYSRTLGEVVDLLAGQTVIKIVQ